MIFKYNLGLKVMSVVSGLKGTITSRSENLDDSVRYWIQPKKEKGEHFCEGWWMNENEIKVLGAKKKSSRKTKKK